MKRLLFLLFAGTLAAEYYRFDIDQDALGGAPDYSWLNQPLKREDRIVARDGAFYSLGGGRVRLFGVNLVLGANFPEQGDAVRIARRLRKMGVNLVRLHHMDSQPDSNPSTAGSILTTGPYPTLNTVAVSRLRAFLDALKAEGIYADLNLHVGYQFRPSVDQVPAMPPGTPFPTQSKPLHIFYPRMVELQAVYTRQVLDALQLNDDPVLGVVEIDNESSLVREWQASNLDRWLVGDYKTEFERQWNEFLAAKYASSDELRNAWGGGEVPGPELLKGNWTLEIHSPGQATLQVGPETIVRVTHGGNWVYLKQVGFSITTERPYLAEVELRAELAEGQSRSIYWDIKQDVSPWNTMTSRTIYVTNQWQEFTMAVQPSFAMNGIGRFALDVQNVEAPLHVRNAGLHQAGRRGLDDNESLEAGTVSLVGENELATDARAGDYLLFLAARDRYYCDTILAAVREKVGALVPVTGTQMGYGGLMNIDSQAGLDYQDNHFYVDHYNFPNVAWDGRDWRQRDQSSLASGMTSFQSMAIARQAGKPYTVSEFNQPWPNTYAAEIDPTLAAFAAFQDWDSIMHFAYSHGRGWDDGVPNGFNMNGDWTKYPGFAQSAWLFRSDAIQIGRAPVEIPVSAALRLRATREKRNSNIGPFLTSVLGYDPNLAFVHPVRVLDSEDAPLPDAATQKVALPFESDTGDMTYDPNSRIFLLHAAKANGVFGWVGGKKITAGAIDVELVTGFAAILVTPIDQAPIDQSKWLFLSNPGSTRRTQPGSSPARPQQIVTYPGTTDWYTLEPEPGVNKPSGNLNGGQRPVWMEKMEAYVTIRTQARQLIVYPLGPNGGRLEPFSAEPVEGGFRLHLASDTPWYEILAN